MPDTKFSDLAAVTTPTAADFFPCIQAGVEKRETRAQLHTLENSEHLVLPQQNTAASPTIQLGAADTGFYAEEAGRMNIAIDGAEVGKFHPDWFRYGPNLSGYPLMIKEATSPTNPVWAFSGDLDTGMGRAGSDQLSHIAGAIEAIRLTEASSHIIQKHEAQVGITAHVGSSQGDGPLLSSYNVISTSASAGDAVTLPATFGVGTAIFIKNDAAVNAIDIFPASGDDAGAGANTAVALAAGVGTLFVAIVANSTWTQMF